LESTQDSWTTCLECQGRGKKVRKLRKKVKLSFQRALVHFEEMGGEGTPPVRPKGHLYDCLNCSGSGLVYSIFPPVADTENYPHVAIIGGGIGGVALAVACKHRGIPFTLYERDNGFGARSQGYGLTLQQASKAIEGLGIFSLAHGVISTRHVVHTTDGKEIGEWGIRKWLPSEIKTSVKRTNIHIARQSLRFALLEQLGGHGEVQWNHQFVDFKETEGSAVDLSFSVNTQGKAKDKTENEDSNAQIKHVKADIVVGADGIRSSVRKLLIGDDIKPLQYLGCIVILGICPLADLNGLESPLLDSATVFQTANGHERIYIMPYDSASVMWQLSFPIPEEDAKALSAKGPQALKEEALKRCQWHDPIPQILTATKSSLVSGYPAYDRELLNAELLGKSDKVTLIGDAGHPMSPFKGQGANQALLDALSLARGISIGCRPRSQWRTTGVRESVLTEFETEMLTRSASKVKGSAEAAQFLHSDVVLHESDEPRGRCLLNKKS
jgi:2-polyprenyl-6-methoxyphenol hydroxylase-like FAD-dependent oxidoreductase